MTLARPSNMRGWLMAATLLPTAPEVVSLPRSSASAAIALSRAFARAIAAGGALLITVHDVLTVIPHYAAFAFAIGTELGAPADRQLFFAFYAKTNTHILTHDSLTGSTSYSSSLLETTAYSARSSEPIPLWTLRTRANVNEMVAPGPPPLRGHRELTVSSPPGRPGSVSPWPGVSFTVARELTVSSPPGRPG